MQKEERGKENKRRKERRNGGKIEWIKGKIDLEHFNYLLGLLISQERTKYIIVFLSLELKEERL